MTLVANVKGYINGDEWGVYEPLLTYEQIVAMATTEGQPRTDTVAELNKHPTEYYTMLSEGNHIYKATHRYMGDYDTIDGIRLQYIYKQCETCPEITAYYRIVYNITNDNRWSTTGYFVS